MTALPTDPWTSRWIIDFDCATEAALDGVPFKPLIEAALRAASEDGVRAWGDRAALVMSPDHVATYFVPLTCGGTGNCTWAVFGGASAREYGIVEGAMLCVQPLRMGKVSVLAYAASSAMGGRMTSYEFKRKRLHATKTREVSTEEAVANPCSR